MKKYVLLTMTLLLSVVVFGQTTYYSKAAATDFTATSSWGINADGTGTSPGSITNADNYIIANSSAMTLPGNAAVRMLTINSGSLTITANTLTVSIASQNNSTLLIAGGTLNLSGTAAINLNGNFSMTSGAINQTGGSITLNGNSGTAGTSVASGTNLFSITGGTPACSAGTITLVNPPHSSYSTSTTRTVYLAMSATATAFTGTHTFIMGDGISTIAGNTDGFALETYQSGSVSLQNLTVNGGNQTGRWTTAGYTSGAYGTHIKGVLTINTNCEFRQPVANQFIIAGGLVNNGTLTSSGSGTLSLGNISTYYLPSVATTVSGTGVYRNNTVSGSSTANFYSLTFNNPNGIVFSDANSLLCTTGGVTNTGTLSGTLTMTNGLVNTNTNPFILGISTASIGTLTYTAGGFTSGSKFGRWYAASTAGTTITAGAVPSVSTGSYPFATGTNSRNFHLYRATTTGATGGVISVQFTDGSGLNTITPVSDAGYSIDRQSAAYWTVSTSGGFAAGTGTFQYAVSGQGIYTAFTTNGRLMKASSVVGTHQAGTTLPHVQRVAIAAADYTGTFYLGLSSNDIPVQTAQSGKWEDPNTWVGLSVPPIGSLVLINSGHTVTVDGTTGTANCGSIVNNAGGTLVVSGGILNVGTSNYNNYFNNNGTLTVSGGNLNINGNLLIANGSSFTQSSGTITIDGNNAGAAATSVASGTPLFGIGTSSTSYATGTVSLTGGLLLIKDPHTATTNSSAYAIYANLSSGVYIDAAIAHTFQFGDGTSTDAGGNTSGFYINIFAGSGKLNFGKITVNNPSGTNRNVTQNSYATAINGDLTVTAGTFDQGTSTTYIGGNINVATAGTILAGGTFSFLTTSGSTLSAQTIPQSVSVSGSGLIKNLATPTAHFTNITINNTSASGVTMNALNNISGNPTNVSSVSGTLTFTAGIITTAGNGLILGTSAAGPGTLSVTSGGFPSGSTFGRWFLAASAGTTITAGAVPSVGTGSFPFITGTNSRNFHLYRATTTGATGGVISVQFADGSGLNTITPVNDGGYSIDRQSAAYWTVSTSGGFAAGTGSFQYAVSGQGIYTAYTTNGRLMKASSVVGTHQTGTTMPHVQRVAIAAADYAGTFYLGLSSNDIPVQTAQSGKWEDGNTWVGLSVPPSGSLVLINSGHTVTVDGTTGTKSCGSIINNAGGTLVVSGGTLNVGTSNYNNYLNNNGALTVSGGNLNINGNLFIATGASFSQSSGTITIDGNNAGSTTGSVASGTPLFGIGTSLASYATGTVSLTGGTLLIKDPHTAATNTNAYAVYAYLSSGVNFNASAAHTLQFGDGSSTDAGGNTSGFYFNTYAGSGRLNFGTVVVNNPSGTNRNVTQYALNQAINGDLTVTAGTFDQGTSTTNVGGNINVATAGTILAGGTFVFCSTTGLTTAAQTTIQGVSVTGSGAIKNLASSPTANFYSITINNTSTTGVTFNALNAIVNSQVAANASYSITFNGLATTPSGKALLWGTATARGTGSLTVTSGGMTAGSTFAVGTTSAQTGTTITSGTDPSFSSGGYPFKDASGNNRYMFIGRATPTAAGIIAATYTDVAGTSAVTIADGAYTVNTLSNGYFTVSTLGTTPSATTFTVAITAPAVFGNNPSNGNSRITYQSSLIGSSAHQNGTTTPTGQRTGLTLANLTSAALYIGINSNDIPFASQASGPWENGSTWNKGYPPTLTDNVTILNGHTVTVNAATGIANNVTINSGGILTVSGSTLTISGTLTNGGTFNANGGTTAISGLLANNATFNSTAGTTTITGGSATGITNASTTGNFNVSGGTVTLGPVGGGKTTFTNNGTLTVSATGILNINGNLYDASSGIFNQSGGNINIDGNAGGNAANSVASGTYLMALYAAVNWTGGTLTIVDPHAATTSTYSIYYSSSTASDVSTNHTLRFGDGSSSDAGGNAVGYYSYFYASSAKLNPGNIIINGPGTGAASATNHIVTFYSTYAVGIMGSVTINNNGEFNPGTTLYLGGNISVNSGGILTATTSIYLTLPLTTSYVVNPNPQQITNNGTIRNLASSPTANFSSIYVNNSSASGVTLNSPLSLSGTLTLTTGLINTTTTNLLTLGTATAAGTISGGSATAYINGPFARTFAASRTSIVTQSSTTLFPTGKDGVYLPLWIDPTTTSGGAVVFRGETFTTNSGTAPDGVTNLSQKRWEAFATSGLVNLTSSYIQFSDAGIVTGKSILQSTAPDGSYGGIPASSIYTTNTLTTGAGIPAASWSGYFAYGNLTPCVAPVNTPTNFIAAYLTSTGFNGSFSGVVDASNYLVVRYTSGATITPPTDYTAYTVGGTLGSGTVVSISNATTFNQTTLTAGATYNYYIYSYNNAACYGPVYNPTGLIGTVTTCGTAVGAPGTPTASLITTNSFLASWTASSTTGVTYILDVALNGSFTTFVSGYQGLDVGSYLSYSVSGPGITPATTFYVRVRANSGGTCYSSVTSTLTATTACNPTATIPAPEGFENSWPPTCWTNQSWGNSTYGSAHTGIKWAYSNTSGSKLTMQGLTLPSYPYYRLKFWYRVESATYPQAMNVLLGHDGLTFGTTLWSITGYTNATYVQASIDLTTYAGQTIYIQYNGLTGVGGTDYGICVDDVTFEAIPPCPPPAALTTANITYNSADLDWTNGGTESAWVIRYGAPGFNPALAGTEITGIGSHPFTLGSLIALTSYDWYVKADCGSGVSAWAGPNSFTTACYGGQVISTTPGERCGTGSVLLLATGIDGTLNWYAASTGGISLGTGGSFLTPVISTTTFFYVGTSLGGSNYSVGKTSTTGTDGTNTTGAGLLFDASVPFTLNSVYVYPIGSGSGTVTIQLQNSSSTVLATKTVTLTGAPSPGTKTLVPLGFDVPVGTGLKLMFTAYTGSISGLLRDFSTGLVPPIAFPYTVAGIVSITNGTLSGYYYYFYDWSITSGCTSARNKVQAKVNPAPDLTVTGNQTICNNGTGTISVTSTLSNYNTYTWSPVDNLYTDFDCNNQYTALTNTPTVYVKSATGGTTTYTCKASNLSGCENQAQTTAVIMLASPGITASPATICVSGTSVLSLSPATGWGAATFQWQSSTNGVDFFDIPGAITISYTTPTITSTSYYQLVIKNSAGSVCSTPQITITVNNPTIISTTPGSRCGIGTVDLGAVGSAGTTLNWYAGAIGGASLYTGPAFTTPIISVPTTYYVEPVIGSSSFNVGLVSNTQTLASYGPYGMYFAATNAVTITSVDIYPSTAGSLTISLKNSSSVVVDTRTFTIVSGDISTTVKKTLTLGFAIPGGSTGWSINYDIAINRGEGSYTYPYTSNGFSITGNTLDGNNIISGTRYYFYNWIISTGCAGPRQAVLATVNTAPALSISLSQTICANTSTPISVTSTVSDFDTYTWAPVTDLFTDVDCLVPYVDLYNTPTVYVKSGTGSVNTYTCSASQSTGNKCSGSAQTVVTILPASPAITGTPSEICVSGSTVLTLTPATGWGAATFQWQVSTNGIDYSDILGSTTSTYTTPTLTSTTYYQVVIKNSAGTVCTTPQITINVNNPQITLTTPGSRCGTGTVILGATGSGTLKWYDVSTGGTSIGSGTSFTTPVISATTDYWVESYTGSGGTISVGPVSPTAQGGTTGTQTVAWNVNFTTLAPTTITSVDIFPIASGQAGVIKVLTGSTTSGTVLATINYTTTISGGNTAQTIVINCALPTPGSYNVYTSTLPSSGVTRNISGAVYPYTSSVANITGNGYDQTYYMGMYNWKFGSACVSAREMVTATVNPAPAITPTADPLTICEGLTSNLNVTSSDPNYSYVWTPGSLAGASQVVSPTATTQYTVSASDAGTGCSTTANITVNVNPAPSAITITPTAPVINLGDVQPLTASGGTIPDQPILHEDFYNSVGIDSWTKVNNSTGGTPANADWGFRSDGYVYSSTTYHSNDNSQFYMTNSDAQGSGGITNTELISPAFNTTGFTTFTLTFWHYFRYLDTDSQARIDVSTDGGTTWDPTPAASFTSTQGAPSAFVKATVNLSAYINQSNLKIRFYYHDTYGWYWCIDNVDFTATASIGFTWAPTTGLFTNPDGTGNYTGGVTPTVYAKPGGTTLYTATATSSLGCTRTKDVTVTVNSTKTLNLSSIFLEGFYTGYSTMMQATQRFPDGSFGPYWADGSADHIAVELHTPGDYASVIYAAPDVPLSTTGTATVSIPDTYSGSYYLTIKQRNHLETVSALPVSFAGASIAYAFDAFSQAYDGNMTQALEADGETMSVPMIFGGDVNQDEQIESDDINAVGNDAAAYVLGFTATDIYPDAQVESSDINIVGNNAALYIYAHIPM